MKSGIQTCQECFDTKSNDKINITGIKNIEFSANLNRASVSVSLIPLLSNIIRYFTQPVSFVHLANHGINSITIEV